MSDRWMFTLSCLHNVVSDDPALEGDSAFCPGCGETYLIVDSFPYVDLDDATGQGRR